MPIGSPPTGPAFRLWVSADVFSLLPRDVTLALPLRSRCRFFHVVDVTVALPFGSRCGFIRVARSLGAPLSATPLTASHRQSHEQNHEQQRKRDNDHHDAGGNRERYKRDADHPPLLPERRSEHISATIVMRKPLPISSCLCKAVPAPPWRFTQVLRLSRLRPLSAALRL
jgi:hypothetical protein